MAANTRSESFPFGVAGVSMGKIERQVPADEPPPLPPNAELAVIGKSVPRVDARAKVTGAVRFTADVALPGMLHARILRSPHAHARILRLDTGAAAAHPGVRAIEIVARAAGGERDPVALYVGAPIVALAATTPALAEEALRNIEIAYQTLPFAVDLDEARKPGSPVVLGEPSLEQSYAGGGPVLPGLPLAGNVRGPARPGGRGDVARGLAEAEAVVEGDYSTQVQTHCCAEPHGIVADWREDGLTVHISTQDTAGVRNELAEAFGLKRSQVRVMVEATGGGFGSKSTLGRYGRIAVALSRQARAPVRLVYDRREEQLDSGNRPATRQHLRIGARRDGTLTALAVEEYGTAGIGVGAGVGNIAQALYTCPNFEMVQYDVLTNAGPASAMRAPGNTPGAFALEQAVDELAEKLGMDPLALRDRIDPSPIRREERRRGAERIGWERRHAPGADAGPVKRGLGVAQSLWGANVHINAACAVSVLRDGSVELRSSVQDIGTGIATVLAQVVAEELGLRPEDVAIRMGDTDYPPGPPSHGSRTTASMTPPARQAAAEVKRKLIALAAASLALAPEDLVAKDGRIARHDAPASGMSFEAAAALMRTDAIEAIATREDDYGGFRARTRDAASAQNDLGGVHFAAVAVDTETGLVRVERIVAVQDCGRPMNPALIESQTEGGVLMGVSYALLEERMLDRHTGHMLNADLEHYKLAGALEVPDIDVLVLENYQGQSATDAYGMAEPATIATAPAIANAVYNAIGVRLRSLPMGPAAILAALGALPQRS